MSAVLEFPAMLHGLTGTVRRQVKAKSQAWAREYLETGGFTPPRKMLQVPSGALLEMLSGSVFDGTPHPRWRVHMFIDVFVSLDEGVPQEKRSRMAETFEAFCLETPWGALYHAVTPPPPRSVARMRQRFAALSRFWDVLQGPRYAYRTSDARQLDELVASIHGVTLEAWCPGGPASVREHLALTVERMAHSTRADCLEAALRVLPALIRGDTQLQHREALGAPGFLRERLAALPPADWEDVSGAHPHALSGRLCAWDRELGRR